MVGYIRVQCTSSEDILLDYIIHGSGFIIYVLYICIYVYIEKSGSIEAKHWKIPILMV